MEYLHLKPNEALPSIRTTSPFKLILISDVKVDPDWQAEISDWLVAAGCFYMMAWGVDCSLWDDSVDWANIHANDYHDIPVEKFVITTWHEDETLEEVCWYAKFTAWHPVHELKSLVVVHITHEARRDLCKLYGDVAF